MITAILISVYYKQVKACMECMIEPETSGNTDCLTIIQH